MKLDSIFKALGVETMEDVSKLSSYFILQEESRGGAEPEEKLIHPNEVIRALRRFAESQRSKAHPGLSSHKEDQEEEENDLDADGICIVAFL